MQDCYFLNFLFFLVYDFSYVFIILTFSEFILAAEMVKSGPVFI